MFEGKVAPRSNHDVVFGHCGLSIVSLQEPVTGSNERLEAEGKTRTVTSSQLVAAVSPVRL